MMTEEGEMPILSSQATGITPLNLQMHEESCTSEVAKHFFFLEYIESSCNVSLLSSCICVYVQIVDYNSKHNAYVEVHRNVINDARVTSDERTNRSITETENTFEAIQTSIRNW